MGPGVAFLVYIIAFRYRQRGLRRAGVSFERTLRVDTTYVAIAVAFTLSLPFRRTVTLIDAVILVAIFVAYLLRIHHAPRRDPVLVGTAGRIASLSKRIRWFVIILLLLVFSFAVYFLGRLFGHRLLLTAQQLHLPAYGLAEWAAPFATVTPELLIVAVYAWRLNATEAIQTLLQRMMQIFLFLGVLPPLFSVLFGTMHGPPVTPLERRGILLAMAETLLVIAVFVDLTLGVREANAILGLFLAQFVLAMLVPAASLGMDVLTLGAIYLVLSVWLLARHHKEFRDHLRDGLRGPYEELEPEAARDEWPR
jgi:cation:H+ antiporter